MSRTRRRGHARFTRNQRDAHALFHLHAGGAQILNLRHIPGDIGAEALLERGIVRVDRATKFGNPYPIGKRYGNRVEVVERYRQDLWRRIRSGDMPLEDLAALHGKKPLRAGVCRSGPAMRKCSPGPRPGQPPSSPERPTTSRRIPERRTASPVPREPPPGAVSA